MCGRTISGSWTSFANLDPDIEHVRNISELLRQKDFEALSSHAISTRDSQRPRGKEDPLTCSIDTSRFTSGRYHVVFEIIFSDQCRWIARIRLPSTNECEADIEAAMLSEIVAIEQVKAKTTIPMPEVYSHNVTLSSDNSCHARFMLMQVMLGRILGNVFCVSVPRPHLEKFTLQFARYYYELSTLWFAYAGCPMLEQSEDSIPKSSSESKESSGGINELEQGKSQTSLEYFYKRRREQTEEVSRTHPGDADWACAAWFLEQAVPSMIEQSRLHGPFPLCHTDTHYNNILVAENYNIGIVDWSDLQTGPVECFSANPEF